MNRSNARREFLESTATPCPPPPGLIFTRWKPPPKLESLGDLVEQAKIVKGMIATFRNAQRFVAEGPAITLKLEAELASADRLMAEAEAAFIAAHHTFVEAKKVLDDHIEMVGAAGKIMQHPDYRDAAIAAQTILETLK